MRMPARASGSNVAATVGRPAVRFQCHGWLPYCALPPARTLNFTNSHGTNTHLQRAKTMTPSLTTEDRYGHINGEVAAIAHSTQPL